MPYTIKNIAPTIRGIFPHIPHSNNNNVVVAIIQKLCHICGTAVSCTTPITPIIRNIFAILLPMTLPYATALCLCIAATVDTVNSGNDVPNAINVNPTTDSFTPHIRANADADDTNKSAPYTIVAIPNIDNAPKDKIDNSFLRVKCRFSGSGSLS